MPERARPPRAILFDLDDTLLMSSASREHAWRRIFAEAGVDGVEPDRFGRRLGALARAYWAKPAAHPVDRGDLFAVRRYLAAIALAEEGLEESLLSLLPIRDYERFTHESLDCFPDALDTLHALKARGTGLALVTNGPTASQRPKVERFGLERIFDCIVIEGEFGRGKPDPAVFRHALAGVGAVPGDAWMVGDHLHFDIGGAQGVGLHAVWHDGEGTGLPQGTDVMPDRIITRLRALLND